MRRRPQGFFKVWVMGEIWILGGTGRTARAVAERLAAAQISPVLVGRDQTRLDAIAANLGQGARVVVAQSVKAAAEAITREQPTVVINTIGPFIDTAVTMAQACLSSSHYVDVSNELASILAVLNMSAAAAAAGRTLVTASGFGVLATESVVLKLCEGQPPALRVRVDAMPMVDNEAGRLGEALAGTIIDSAVRGGRRYAEGRLERAAAFGDFESFARPDGVVAKTSGVPTGDLEAARRASGARFAVAASSMTPSAPVLRTVLPPAMAILQIKAIADLARRRLAAVEFKAEANPGQSISWTRARVEWVSGETREAWLRTGDAMAFTSAATAEVAIRLARGEGRPGAFTPGALFGPDLAVAAGGVFVGV